MSLLLGFAIALPKEQVVGSEKEWLGPLALPVALSLEKERYVKNGGVLNASDLHTTVIPEGQNAAIAFDRVTKGFAYPGTKTPTEFVPEAWKWKPFEVLADTKATTRERLAALRQLDPTLDELQIISMLPYWRYVPDRSLGVATAPILPRGWIVALKSLRYRAQQRAQSGRWSEAVADYKAIRNLCNLLQQELLLISDYVACRWHSAVLDDWSKYLKAPNNLEARKWAHHVFGVSINFSSARHLFLAELADFYRVLDAAPRLGKLKELRLIEDHDELASFDDHEKRMAAMYLQYEFLRQIGSYLVQLPTNPTSAKEFELMNHYYLRGVTLAALVVPSTMSLMDEKAFIQIRETREKILLRDKALKAMAIKPNSIDQRPQN